MLVFITTATIDHGCHANAGKYRSSSIASTMHFNRPSSGASGVSDVSISIQYGSLWGQTTLSSV